MARTPKSKTPALARAKPARKRTPGRPAGDGPDLRVHLLDAAIACFTRDGIAGTSLRAIAREAAVTPALLHYYFGDKDQLVNAIVAERLGPVLMEMRSVLEGDNDVGGLVIGFVTKMSELIQRYPWWPALWVREVLCEGGVLRELIVSRVGPQLPQLLAQRFAQAQKEGRLSADLDPRLLVVSLIGLTMFPAAGAPIWRAIFGAGDIDSTRIRDHAIALLGRGLNLENA
ncbi:TetR/AcrR family transcriptional regulator [Lysobacter tyrosinilyticus]